MREFEGEYWTVSKLGRAELVVKGSRFLARAFPVSSPEDAEGKIEAIRNHYSDATHNCYAYRVGKGQHSVYRFDDAGEPAGTAGRPILQAIDGKGLTDVAVVVTRYFGGTKLGAGGLVRSYSAAAAAALEDAEPIRKFVETEMVVTVPYPFFGAVQQVLQECTASVRRTEFAERVTMVVSVPISQKEVVTRRLLEATAGRASIRE